jgi:hypothetical protein
VKERYFRSKYELSNTRVEEGSEPSFIPQERCAYT